MCTKLPVCLVVMSLMACQGDRAGVVNAMQTNSGGEPRMVSTIDLDRVANTKSNAKFTALNKAVLPKSAICQTPPVQDAINASNAVYQDYYLSAKRAVSLGIPIVNAAGNTDYLVIVRDYRRFKPCIASDQKTEVHYGQVIRAVIEVTGYDASTKLSLPTLAAQATISGKQQYFYLYRQGWYNPKVDSVLQSVSGKVFDVENYGLYQAVMPQLIGMMSQQQTVLAAEPIYWVPSEDDPGFVFASARTWAYAQMKDGKSCAEAAKKFAADPGRATAVTDTYSFLKMPGCTVDKPSAETKLKATSALAGIGVK